MAFADASVEASADFARFDQEFPTKLRSAVSRATRAVVAEFRRAGTSAGRAFADAVGDQLGRITVAARRTGAETGRAFAAAAQNFTRNIDVGFKLSAADGTRLGQQFRTSAEKATRRIPVSFSVTPSARASGRITGQRFRAGAREFTTDIPISFDASRAAVQGRTAGFRYRVAAERNTRNISASISSNGVGKATSAVTGLVGSLRSALIPLAVLGAAMSAFPAANFIGALLPLTGLLTLLPGALFTAVGAFTVLGVSIERIGELIKSNLLPAFAGLRDQIAKVVTAGLGGQLSALGAVLAGPVRTGALQAAAALNQVLLGLTDVGRQAATANAVTVVFRSVTLAFTGLADALPALITGMRDLAVAVAPVFDDFLQDITDGIGGLGRLLSAAAAGGRAFEWAQAASTALRLLIGSLVSIASIFTTTFSAASAVGGNILLTINRMLSSFDAFLRSAEGAAILNAVFTTLKAITDALAPVFATVLGAVARLIAVAVPGLVPLLQVLSDLVVILVGALEPALVALQPLFAAVRTAIAAVLVPLGPIIAQIGAILPQVLGPIATVLSELVTQLAPVVSQLVTALGGALMPIFQALIPIVLALIPSLQEMIPPIVAMIPPITELVIALTPLITAMAQVIVLAVQLIAPILKLVTQFSAMTAINVVIPIISKLVDVLGFLLAPLARGTEAMRSFGEMFSQIDLGQLARNISDDLAGVRESVRDFFASIGRFFASIPGQVSAFARTLREGFVNAFNNALDAGARFVSGIIDFLTALPGRIAGFLARLPGILVSAMERAFFAALEAVAFGVTSIVVFFIQLPGRVREALITLGTAIATFFTDLWNNAVALTTIGLDNVVNFLTTFPERAGAAIARLKEQIFTFFTNLWTGARERTVSGIESLIAFAATLPERIAAALSTLTTQLVTFFTNLWNQVTATVSSGIDRTVDFFRALPGRIGAFAGRMLDVGRLLISKLGEGLSNLGAISGDFAAKIIDRVRSFINRAIDSIERGINRATSKIGININLPALAKGAVLSQPTVALLAERGPEVVIPLNNPARAQQLVNESGLGNIVNLSRNTATNVRVFIGERELSDIVRVETDQAVAAQGEALAQGPRFVGA